MTVGKFLMSVLQLLQSGKANKNSSVAIEVVFWSALLIVHGQLQFFHHHHIFEYFCEEK